MNTRLARTALVGDGLGAGGDLITVGAGGSGNGGPGGDPTTCAEAAKFRTNIGCDFWTTPVSNMVWSVFDYAVVAANAGDKPDDITVTRGNVTVATATVAPNDLAKIYLPWILELKGPETNECGSVTSTLSNSLRVANGAYHLVSTNPVTVYQFSALEYGPQGGPPGKDWSACPAYSCIQGIDCFSYTNDASLLLPSTAMTGNDRVASSKGWVQAKIGAYFAILVYANKPGQVIVGIQVMGYGTATSYQYPGGINLKTIAPPPPPPN